MVGVSGRAQSQGPFLPTQLHGGDARASLRGRVLQLPWRLGAHVPGSRQPPLTLRPLSVGSKNCSYITGEAPFLQFGSKIMCLSSTALVKGHICTPSTIRMSETQPPTFHAATPLCWPSTATITDAPAGQLNRGHLFSRGSRGWMPRAGVPAGGLC